MKEVEDVRCVLYGVQRDQAFVDTVALLRGVAALYGDGLDVQVEPSGSVSEYAAVLAEKVVDRPREHFGQPCARILCGPTPSEDPVSASASGSEAAGSRQREIVLFGKNAIAAWMRTRLETRVAAAAAGDGGGANGTLNGNASATKEKNRKSSGEEEPIRIFVSGDRSQVGKSTVCLGLVGSLLRHGFAPSEIGYIKPATQCEKPQLIAKFCRHNGITCCDVGPIVFYSGFTREFLKGNTEPPEELLAKAKAKVDEVGRGKKVVVVDGVGYPAVGSICGVSNAAVARAVRAPVVLVGKRGVGDAVDSFNLNSCFFESQGVNVLGALFNRLPADGYYSLENCKASVEEYFHQFQPQKTVYGFIPEIVYDESSLEDDAPRTETPEVAPHMTAKEARQATQVIDTFYQSVNLAQLLDDATRSQSSDGTAGSASVDLAKRARPTSSGSRDASTVVSITKSRADIQAEAKASGAAGG